MDASAEQPKQETKDNTAQPSQVATTVPLKKETPAEEFQEQEESASIIVKNVAQSTDPESPTTKQLADFFSFCGNISSLTLIPDESDPQIVSAVVTFENSSAARTALLLNHTFLNERSIIVELAPFNLAVPPPESSEDYPRHFDDSGPQTQESVIKNLVNQGYQVGVGALESARAYDEEHKISQQMNDFAKKVESQVNAIDSEYQISEKVNHVVGQVTALDNQYGISSGIQDAVHTASAQVQALDSQYQISASVASGVRSAQTQVVELDNQYHISSNIVAGAEKAAQEGVKLLTSINQELDLEQRSKDAQEAISYGATQVAEFLETNETVQEIGSFFNAIGTSLFGAAPDQPSIEIVHETAAQPSSTQ